MSKTDGCCSRPATRTVRPRTLTFKDRHVLKFGTDRLDLAYHGPNHTPDNISIYAPRHRTLMVVDVLFPGWAPFKNLAVSQDIPGWVRTHDIAMDHRWTTLVGGHVGRLGVRADGDLQRQYIQDLDARPSRRWRPSTPLRSSRNTGRRATLGDLQDLSRRGRAASSRPHHRQVPRQARRSRRLHRRQRLRAVRVTACRCRRAGTIRDQALEPAFVDRPCDHDGK